MQSQESVHLAQILKKPPTIDIILFNEECAQEGNESVTSFFLLLKKLMIDRLTNQKYLFLIYFVTTELLLCLKVYSNNIIFHNINCLNFETNLLNFF